jgi:hypothetical protein
LTYRKTANVGCATAADVLTRHVRDDLLRDDLFRDDLFRDDLAKAWA